MDEMPKIAEIARDAVEWRGSDGLVPYPEAVAAMEARVDAILEGRRSCADFRHGGPLTEAVLVGAIADRFPDVWLEWESEALRFRDHPAASALVRRTYRDGWKVEGLG